MTLADVCELRPACPNHQIVSQNTVADIRLGAVTAQLWGVGQKYTDIVQHCGLLDNIKIRSKMADLFGSF